MYLLIRSSLSMAVYKSMSLVSDLPLKQTLMQNKNNNLFFPGRAVTFNQNLGLHVTANEATLGKTVKLLATVVIYICTVYRLVDVLYNSVLLSDLA